MALKDWKKTGKDEWLQRKNNRIIFIEEDKFNEKKYAITIATGLAPSQHRVVKEFKTKKEALTYAKAYMRKH